MHVAHLAPSELVLILLRDEDHGRVQDESNLRLSKLHLTACCGAMHHDRSCDHQCDNELHQLCVAQQFAELLGDHRHGTNDHYLDDHCDQMKDDHDPPVDDHDLLEDDLPNHHDHTTDDHRDLLTDDHDLLEDDLSNHHDHTTDDLHDLLMDDRDLGHHFVRTQDDLLVGYLDGPDVHPDCQMDDLGLRLVCLYDPLIHRVLRDARVCRILLPVVDDVDRDFLGLALGEVYLQSTPKHRR